MKPPLVTLCYMSYCLHVQKNNDHFSLSQCRTSNIPAPWQICVQSFSMTRSSSLVTANGSMRGERTDKEHHLTNNKTLLSLWLWTLWIEDWHLTFNLVHASISLGIFVSSRTLVILFSCFILLVTALKMKLNPPKDSFKLPGWWMRLSLAKSKLWTA